MLGFKGELFFLSNFYPVELEIHGKVFPTVENAYQFAKIKPEHRDRYLLDFQNVSPGYAKKLGRRVPLREDWELIKLG